METTMKNSRLTPRFFFISLGVIVTLITSVSSFLVLFFEALNNKFPDVINSVYQYGYYSYNFESIRGSLATIIIFFPTFIYLSYLWIKESRSDIGRINMVLRKWMIYFILFLATLLVIIDLVTLVNYFISGEITIRFILKVIGVLIVGGLVDLFYSSKMKNINFNSDKSKKLELLYCLISVLFVLGLITWSFAIMGSPVKQRAWRLDGTRVSDLQNIQGQIISYWQQKEKLPESLSELSNPISNYYLPIDPESNQGRLYEYKITDKLSFELCATFTLATPVGPTNQAYNRVPAIPVATTDVTKPVSSDLNDSWYHGTGRTCFSRTIDKDIYPPIKK